MSPTRNFTSGQATHRDGVSATNWYAAVASSGCVMAKECRALVPRAADLNFRRKRVTILWSRPDRYQEPWEDPSKPEFSEEPPTMPMVWDALCAVSG